MDYYLKATSSSALARALVDAGVATCAAANPEMSTLRPVSGADIDAIGQVVTFDQDGAATVAAGFHANLRVDGELTNQQRNALPLISPPLTPYRAWA